MNHELSGALYLGESLDLPISMPLKIEGNNMMQSRSTISSKPIHLTCQS
jgi:hypothetical protein